MKLLRYGAKGAEKPGLLDAQGQVRDLSGDAARHHRRHAVARRAWTGCARSTRHACRWSPKPGRIAPAVERHAASSSASA